MQKHILFEIKNFSEHQLFTKYKILVNADGSVYDKRNKHNFASLVDWARDRLDSSQIHDTITE